MHDICQSVSRHFSSPEISISDYKIGDSSEFFRRLEVMAMEEVALTSIYSGDVDKQSN